MTPTLVLDPVVAAALLGGVTVWAGCGDLDLTCPECGGSGTVPVFLHPLSPFGTRRCEHCTGGRIVPVSGPHNIATTTQRPKRGQHFGASYVNYETETGVTTLRSPGRQGVGIHVGAVVGFALNVEWLPIERCSFGSCTTFYEHVSLDGDHLSIVREEFTEDISEALPWGVWSGWAARFTGITDTIPCPICGDGGLVNVGLGVGSCPTCRVGYGDGPGTLPCPVPFAAPDRPTILTELVLP